MFYGENEEDTEKIKEGFGEGTETADDEQALEKALFF